METETLEIKQICRQLLAESDSKTTEAINRRASELIKKTYPLESVSTHAYLLDEILFSLWGLGPIEALLRDPKINEIMINGPGKVWIEQKGELILTDLYLDLPAIQILIEKIVSPLGLRVDRSNPQVDARLLDGARAHIIKEPLAIDGPYITIRRFIEHNFEIADFCSDLSSSTSENITNFLNRAVGERKNIIVSGGASSGKTTLLNVLAKQINTNHRVVTIEDTAELSLNIKNLVQLQTRSADLEGRGVVTQTDLVKTALRMRPDCILVGEVRGPEALDMIQAMNTGNEGSLSSCHSNSAKDTLSRLETMILMAGVGLTLEAIRSQIKSAVDLIVHLQKTADGKRQIVDLAELSEDSGFKQIFNL